MTEKIIIDTDPGIDDAMAILYAAQAPEIDLVGLTSIFGNVTVSQATRNALRLVEMARLKIPVAQGAERPMIVDYFEPGYHVHGFEGFGDYPAEEPNGDAIAMDAADFLISKAAEMPGELIICPVGPMTNIATAIQRDSSFAKNVKKIVLMGGSIREGGNITSYAEANFYNDPHAAQIVMSANCEVVMMGLDATHRTWATREDMLQIALEAPRLGKFLADIANFYIDFYVRVRGEQGCFLHDPLAIICATNPELFSFEEHPVDVIIDGEEIGRSVIAPHGTIRAQKVAVGVDDRVKQKFMDTLKAQD